MSTISVWNIDLEGAVMGVTGRRDGFRNSSDERSKVMMGGLTQLLASHAEKGANNRRSHPTVPMSFSADGPRYVAILSYAEHHRCTRFFSCFWRRPESNQPIPDQPLVPAHRRRQGWRAG